MIKKIWVTTILFAPLTLFPTLGLAQEHPGCFQVDTSGTVIDLNNICQGRSQSNVFQLPIKSRRGGTPIVEVTFNGNQTVEMLFDTGATSTLIVASLAQKLSLKPLGTERFGIADGSVVEMSVAKIDSMQSGGLTARDLIVGIAPPEKRIGLLGQDFFGAYDITIRENFIELRRR